MKSEQHGKFKTVPEYVKSLPANRKAMFVQMRNAIKQAAPLAEEVISYNMPAFRFSWYIGLLRLVRETYWVLPDLICNKSFR